MTTFSIAGEVFGSQRAARARAGAVLGRYPLWAPVRGQDESFIAALFWYHPRALQKAGPGVHHFAVGPAHHGPTLNLFVVRADSSLDDFSIKTAVAAAARNTKEMR